MRTIRRFVLIAFFAMIAALTANRPGATPDESIAVKLIRYDELGDEILDRRGQVVVVDFWADYCLPCKREFPKLVALHRKYASQGLSVLAVSLDDPADSETRERVQRFLTAQKASFVNFLLAEKPAVWQAKLKIDGPPCVFLFNRRGELLKRYQDTLDYPEIERLVSESLRK